ncbi:MAG: nitroreductase family protein [Alphaproteobacteria bacterium]
MKNILFPSLFLTGMLFAQNVYALETKPLPEPQTNGGKPLMEALKDRKTSRSFSDKPLEAQVLSDMLWAAFGVNRPAEGKRTAPTAMNKQNIDVYVLDAAGVWRYEAKENVLILVLEKDLRPVMESQPFAAEAPVTLLYVAENDVTSGMHAGSLYQNVGLFCASAGLHNVVRRMDKDRLTQALPLPAGKEVIVSQSVGYP